MKRVLTALVLIPLVLVLVFLGPQWQWLFSLTVAGVAALAGWEYLNLTKRCGANPPRVATPLALLALFAANFAWPDSDHLLAVFGVLGLGLLVEAMRGIALGGLWLADRGAWMAVGASAAWSWTLGALVRGGLVDVRFAAAGDASAAALIVAGAAAVAAVLWARRRV